MVAISTRVRDLDWPTLTAELDGRGYALTPPLLTDCECNDLAGMYPNGSLFRSHIVMARYRFGSGDYKYFANPLPRLVMELREQFYRHLAPVANRWHEYLGLPERFPPELTALLNICHQRGQTRPTPLLLRYEAGDFNCLHQDLYGEIAFPLQITCFLSRKGKDYEGGEFVLTEQQPRAQSKAEVITPEQGQMLIFTTRYRPAKGSRGYYRVNVRHGVSRIRKGRRYTMGVIFHDAL